MQPVVIRRQVELAQSAGDRGTAAHAHQPVVVAEVLADLAGHRQQRGRGLLDLVERAGERVLGDGRVVAVGEQDLALPFEFLDEVHLEVGTPGDLEDFEQRGDRDVMLVGPFILDEVPGLVEQILKTQQSADAFVEGIFVSDHAAPPVAKVAEF